MSASGTSGGGVPFSRRSIPEPIVVVMLAFPADTDCDTRHLEGPASHLTHDRPADGRCRRVATLVSLRRVYTHGKSETAAATSATLVGVTPKVPYRRRVAILGAVVVVAAGTVATVVALNRSRVAFEEEHTRPLAVGDCVAVTAAPPDAVQTRRSSCADDPSFTIGAMADGSGSCPTAEYQHFPAPSADRVTAELCLVPNLVAEHCYRLGHADRCRRTGRMHGLPHRRPGQRRAGSGHPATRCSTISTRAHRRAGASPGRTRRRRGPTARRPSTSSTSLRPH